MAYEKKLYHFIHLITTPILKLFAGQKPKSGDKPPVSDETVRQAEKLTQHYQDMAERHTRTGSTDVSSIVSGYEADMNLLMIAEMRPLKKAKARLAVVRDSLKARIDSFVKASAVAAHYGASAPERTREAEQLKRSREMANRSLHESQQEKEPTRKHLQATIATYGKVPEKLTFWNRLSILAMTGGCFDLGVTSTTFISSGTIFWMSIMVAAALCGCLSYCSHMLGWSMVYRPKTWRNWLWGGGGLLVLLALFRAVMGDGISSYLLITSGFITVLFILGALEAYIKAGNRVLFVAQKASDDIDEKERQAADAIEYANNSLDNQEGRFEGQAETAAINQHEANKTELDRINKTLAGLDSDIEAKKGWFDCKTKSDKANILNAAERGQKSHYTPFKLSSALSKVGIFTILLVSVVSCESFKEMTEDPVIYEEYCFFDKSPSTGTEYQDDKKAFFKRLDKTTHYTQEFKGRRQIIVHFVTIGQNSLARDIVVELPLGEPYYNRNVPKRQKELGKFERELDSVITLVFQAPTEPNSIIHRAVARGLKRLAVSESTHKHCTIVSDFIGVQSVNLTEYWETPEKIEEDSDKLIAQMLKDQPLPDDLSAINVQLFCVNQVDFHTQSCKESGQHSDDCTFSSDFLSFPCARLFERLYLQHGASVTLERNF